MRDIEHWNSKNKVAELLADQLLRGNLLPCLGAGVSRFADLPDWKSLLVALAPSEADSSLNDYVLAERVLQREFRGDKQAFYKQVHKSLFRGKTSSNLKGVIQADAGLRALSMLCFRSVRGGSRFVVTFNYDDLLDLYLKDLGLVCNTVDSHRFVFGKADVCVLHPHGLLRLQDKAKDHERRILIAQSDFSQVRASPWSSILNTVFSKHFPIFIGLGGADILLYEYIDDANRANFYFEDQGWPYSGVRFCSTDDIAIEIFESKKIKCVTFADIAREWPEFISNVCRIAAKKIERY